MIVWIAFAATPSSAFRSKSMSKPFDLPSTYAVIARTATCATYAFVDATAISGPACSNNV